LLCRCIVSGNPVIFTPNRKLIREGEVERVKVKKNGEVDVKLYYAHLFNDAFIYSSKNRVTGGYKLHKAIDLKGAEIKQSNLGGMKVFSLASKADMPGEEEAKLRFQRGSESWFVQIQAQIDALKAARRDKRASALTVRSDYLQGVNVASLGMRGAQVYQFLVGEMQFAEVMGAMNVTVIQPLIDASKGAVLSAVKIKTANNAAGDGAEAELKDNHSDALFNANLSR
jgi:hypothetical protein